ncbi:LADA_0H09978g1_1 [Lachancea dasiensis]|uniref:Monopolar spindle protein 2 n=1 Tax=Lachancea dasiensis TaxID=1072105 RepID=A0A1G4K2Z7_9SACH|nr:LADA_0H09978g1_1 [Lachancea dasiensis]
MSDIVSRSIVLLDQVWPSLDNREIGYIYAKDFPLAVSKMEELLRKANPKGEKQTLVSKAGEEIIKKFGTDQEFFKVYKEDFAELFDGLIGHSFASAVDRCCREGGSDISRINRESISFRDNEETPVEAELLREELLAIKQELTMVKGENVDKDQAIAARDAIIADLRQKKHTSDVPSTSSPSGMLRSTKLQAQVARLQEDLRTQVNVIRDKDRESLDLARELDDLKDKYQFLEREFQFYKDHGEGQKPASAKEATKHEFIILELRRKIEEQSDMIAAMRQQVESKYFSIPAMNSGTVESGILSFVPISRILRSFIGVVLLVIVVRLFWAVLFGAAAVFNSDEAQALNSKIDFEWWEQSSLLSKMHWYFTDRFESGWGPASDEVLDANYNKVFGV